jgi:hypothetical protein
MVKNKSFIEQIFAWQYPVHLVLVTLLVFFYFTLIHRPTIDTNIFFMFFEFIFVLGVSDILVHLFFWFAPKKIQWRD